MNFDDYMAREFVKSFNEVSLEVHTTAIEKGFWDQPRNEAEMIALEHSELSEALEASRHNNPPDDKIPDFSGVEAEMADTVIRIMDHCVGMNYDLAGAIIAKIEYNKGRPYKHGKEF